VPRGLARCLRPLRRAITSPLIARVPSRRMSSLDEVAKAVVFLASDDASNIHGSTLSVDGGFSAV
jgi:NAD(P)-dependent dehydrogenase (short-subunit alcohol dehydrogenase family)